MRVEELVFWLQWYLDWGDALKEGKGSVWISNEHVRYAGSDFEKTILRVYDLVQRAGGAPVPLLVKNFVLGAEEESQEHDPMSDCCSPEAVVAVDWPAPGVSEEAAKKLCSLVREPYVYAAGDPCHFGRAPLRSLERLVVSVRAAALIGQTAAAEDEESLTIAQELRDALAEDMFSGAMWGLDFLSAEKVDEILAPLGLQRETVAPFHRFVAAESPSDMLCSKEWDDYPEYVPVTDYQEPDRCEDCGEQQDPELDYCWTCQCEGKDWD